MDRKTLVSLYRKIELIRSAEEKVVELYSEQEIRCPVHLCIGQEAVAAGVCEALDDNDIVFSNHRSHGHYLAKGGDINGMVAEMYGKASGCSNGRGGSMHLIDLSVNFLGSTSIVGGTIPLAVGTALSSVLQKKTNLSVVFFGDGATEEGVFHESLNFAALKKLPVLFICENNLYAVNTHIRDRQPKRKISDIVKAQGITVFNEDGNDAIKAYEVAKKAVDIIKGGEGPVFIEFSTYRWRQHCGPDYDYASGCRPEQEFKEWKERCAKDALAKELLRQKVLTEDEVEQIKRQIKLKVDKAFDYAKKSEFPKKESLTEHLFLE